MNPFDDDPRTFARDALKDESILSGQFWGELRVFLAVAKAKSFNRAAEMLGTSQPTVSRQVKRLQDVVGSQLFVLTKQGVRLTPEGEGLAQALMRLDYSLYALTSDLRAQRKEAEGLVRISVTDGLNTLFVAPALPAFSAAHPKIRLHLKSPTNVARLRENQTDLMVGFMPAHAPDVTVRRIGSIHLIPIATNAYVRESGLPTRQNAEQHCFLQSEFYAGQMGPWEPWNRVVARARQCHLCDNSMAYGMLVKAGAGIGLLGSYAVREPSAIPLELDVRVSVPLYALALTDRLNIKAVRLVFDWLCDLCAENPWLSDEFRLDCPPSRHDLGMRLLFNF